MRAARKGPPAGWNNGSKHDVVGRPALQPNHLPVLQACLAVILVKVRQFKLGVGKTAPRTNVME
jgi:hypothetical protein